MRCLGVLVLTVSAVGWILPGCVADHASAIDEADSMSNLVFEVPDKPADPNDPFGSCMDSDPNDTWPFASCSNKETGCYGWGTTQGCTDGDFGCAHLWQVCDHICEEASDCPVPATGDAVPACMQTRCVLPCNEATVCPDGFVCASATQIGAEDDTYGWVCMQYNH